MFKNVSTTINSTFVVIGVCLIILQNGVSSEVEPFSYEVETGVELSPPIYFGYYKGDNITMMIHLKNREPNVFAALTVTSQLGNHARKESLNAENQSYFIIERQLTQDTISIDLELSAKNSCSCSRRISEGRLVTGTTNSTYEYSGICSVEFCNIVLDVKKQCKDAEGKPCLNSVSACYSASALLLLLAVLINM